MSDCIRLPRTALSDEMWRDKDLWQLYGYLLSRADENGVVEVSLRCMAKETGQSLQTVRTNLKKLVSTQRLTQEVTQQLTQITLCGIGNKTVRATQRLTQRPTQLPTHPQDGFERFKDYFNTAVADTSIPQITKLTDSRKTALRSIFKEYGKETVETVIKKTIASDFLSKDWGKVSFDWIFKKANFIKILEGNYDNRTDNRQTTDKYSARRGTDIGNLTEADYGGPF